MASLMSPIATVGTISMDPLAALSDDTMFGGGDIYYYFSQFFAVAKMPIFLLSIFSPIWRRFFAILPSIFRHNGENVKLVLPFSPPKIDGDYH